MQAHYYYSCFGNQNNGSLPSTKTKKLKVFESLNSWNKINWRLKLVEFKTVATIKVYNGFLARNSHYQFIPFKTSYFVFYQYFVTITMMTDD
jgi:hypothetical protein